ncbi:serine threonine-protein kinase sgk2 [Colletotrichum musicola]|uniref:non-specific serine/threonine protein kinase n=1 Tax=Colletotrichum musicola TaxID=2175873 RepID=A0A8H6K4J2_9PEZI|nr:serine threonine-protein kinase sgk2 [Colletotrichum musicola]
MKSILILALAALAAAKTRTSQAACAFIASHQEKHPGYAVPATAAFECLNSVPVDTQGDLALIGELKQLWQFHSETGWLKNPGPDWEDGPIDIIGELDKVKSGLEAGTYQSEYEVQMAIQSITVRSGSDHLTYNPDILRVFVFVRHFSVASISSDGKALPKLYVNTDVAALANGDSTVSDIKSINGMDPYDFLKANFFSPSRASDGRMNAMFSTGDTKGMGRFRVQEMYRGPTTDVVWSNSKKTSFQNIAGIRQDFSGVFDGESFFRKFCTGALTRHHSGKSKRGEDGVIPPNILDPAPTIPNGTYHPSARVKRRDIPFKGVYPIAVAGNKGSNVAGYFLEDDGFEDVAVLKIISFDQPKNGPADFEDTIRSFLNQSIAHNKQKLVIDLRENGGGLAHLCLGAFMQLFPDMEPFAGMRYRATDVYNKIGDVVSDVRREPLLAAQVDLGPLRRFWDLWGLRTARGDSFDSREQFKGPVSVNDDDFTATCRWGYTTGYKGRYPTAFDPSIVVILTDASCHSACAALHEELRNIAGVKTVTVGGRPENGPIQAVTGTRGGHIVELSELAEISRIALGISSDYELRSEPAFHDDNGWKGWPQDANEKSVLEWLADFVKKLVVFADTQKSNTTHQRSLLAQPNTPMQGSTADRKLDVGFVDNLKADQGFRYHWKQILVPGELKSNPSADTASKAWLDLGRYAREVLVAQDTRRFVLGFTLCGSLMRVWSFDRLGAIASEQFDINKDGLQFVSTVLGFLWMNEEALGFDPTIKVSDGDRFINIKRNGSTERIVIDGVILRARCVAGRAATCWKAHPEGHPETPLVIKDSWQYPERDEEGDLLREVTDKDVVNVARYYHHETVQVHETDDDIWKNIRHSLDVTVATNYQPGRQMRPSNMAKDTTRKGRGSTSRKRPSSQTDSVVPLSKRSCSVSPTKAASTPPNRVHRHIILQDYGKPIYKASSRPALLAALVGCIEGHESLYKAGILHRDISINNLMINEESGNPSWPAFLIDLDLAIREPREGASGAKGKTGTRAFMAIGALLGEQHSFMHDLESFFWVLFWICIHYNANGKDVGSTEFDSWNYEGDNKLILSKVGTIGDESLFLKIAVENFTPYHQPLVTWVNRLHKEVFPSGERWKQPEPELYSSMKKILHDAQEDRGVLADG